MRRKDREVTEIKQIREILNGCKTCRLAMVDRGLPYVVPLNYAYQMDGDKLTLYFHSAKEGRKIDALRANPVVCFDISNEGASIHAEETPCNSGYYYSSVLGFGIARFVNDVSEKCIALMLITKHQSGADAAFTPEQADSVCIFKVASSEFTGKKKQRPY